MIRKYHNHTLQTNPRHLEEEPQYTYSNKTCVRQQKQSNQFSLFLFKMIAKLKKGTKQCAPKQRQTQNPHEQWEAQLIIDQQQNVSRKYNLLLIGDFMAHYRILLFRVVYFQSNNSRNDLTNTFAAKHLKKQYLSAKHV